MEIPQNRYLFACIDCGQSWSWYLFLNGKFHTHLRGLRIANEKLASLLANPPRYVVASGEIDRDFWVLEEDFDDDKGYYVRISEFEEHEYDGWHPKYREIWKNCVEMNALLELTG